MDIAALEAFVSVAQTGSFSESAKRLFITQSAVSKRIAGLETSLEEKLFDRVKRQVLLTDSGKALLPHAKAIISEMEQGRRAIQQASDEISGNLSLATSHHIGLHRLPPILRQYTTEYAKVELDIRFVDSEEACQAVEDGDIEIGIVTLPVAPAESLLCTPLWEDKLEFVTGHDHPMHSLEDLSRFPAILPAKSTYTGILLEKALRPLGVELNTRLSSNYLETIKMMVSVGLGWSVLPQSMIDEELQVIPLDDVDLSRQLGIVQHRKRTLSNAALALVARLTQSK